MENIFVKNARKGSLRDYYWDDGSKEKYYTHPTFYVDNLADYIRLISNVMSSNKNELNFETIVYRGMSNQEYDLSPGLARVESLDPDVEKMSINDFLTYRPDAFKGLSEFDVLAKMQHYGLPTRLLDFTLNPLVALYFACESDFGKNGRVLCHSAELLNDSSDLVNVICTKAIRTGVDDNYTLDEYLGDSGLLPKKYLSELYLYRTTTVVRPKYWNNRIANQAGVFMLFPNDMRDSYNSILFHANEIGLDVSIKEYGRGKIDVDYIQEAFIREPVQELYNPASDHITCEEFLKMYNLYNKDYKSKGLFWGMVAKRFKMNIELKQIDSNVVRNKFCSIIIEGKRKKRILEELSNIGIGINHIYPELEYTAREIKQRYMDTQ